MKKITLFHGFALIAAIGILDAHPGKAVCLSTGDSGANDCLTFDGTTTTATQIYQTPNLTTNNYVQLGFYSSNKAKYTLANVQYSQDGNTYSTIGFVTSTGTSGFDFPNFFNPLSFNPVGTPFYVKYTMLGQVEPGVTITSRLLTNSSGIVDGNGVLISTGNWASVDRDSSVPVPAPLPILGATAAFARVKRFRAQSKTLSRIG